MEHTRTFAMVIASCLALICNGAAATPIDFEAFTDLFPLTNEISGFDFSGGTVLTAGVSLNEIDYPPSSGTNVLAAFSGSLTVTAVTPFNQFAANFTFDEPLNFSGFDDLGNLLFSFDSSIAYNLGSYTQIGYSEPGIASLVITSQSGDPFTMDDLSVATVPEPSTLGLIPLGALAAVMVRRGRKTIST